MVYFPKILNISTAGQKKAYYLVSDDDVNVVCIENINSIMNDNKLLILANSKRIRLITHYLLLFEVENLKFTSPATISQFGICFMNIRILLFEVHYQRSPFNHQDLKFPLLKIYLKDILNHALISLKGNQTIFCLHSRLVI
jgi:hypothetical protein